MEDLKLGLEEYAEVVWDYEEFWKCENEYDIVHLHWPEFLSYEVQSYVWETCPFPEALINKIKACLEHWKKHSTIVYTRHVQYPHARHDKDFLDLYRLVTSYCDTVIHFASYSIQQFKEFYPEHAGIEHVVIAHHNYESLPNTISRKEARKELKINQADKVMLVFGLIKEHEKALIEQAYGFIPGKDKVLLAPKWEVTRRKISYIRLREWVWNFEKWVAKQNNRRIIDKGFVEEENAQIYLNAADFLFIPRTNELNSGNITLGCTFGLIVVGKKGSDIGEILEETGNPTFEVGHDQSLQSAIERVYQLKTINHGEKNKALALTEWSVPLISKQYIDVMKHAVKKKYGKIL